VAQEIPAFSGAKGLRDAPNPAQEEDYWPTCARFESQSQSPGGGAYHKIVGLPDAITIRVNSSMEDIFGARSEQARRFRVDRLWFLRPGNTIDVSSYIADCSRAIAVVESAIENAQLQSNEDRDVPVEPGAHFSPVASVSQNGNPSRSNNDVFIVHGHDSLAKAEVARFLERAGLVAIILHEQRNAGRTIIEKFEAHGGSAGFAVVLATPDDVGGPDRDNLRPRARQNVIGEMFWFAGRLGRNRVCVLVKGEVEMPSDFAGVVYTTMDDGGAWKGKLLGELTAAGYTVDWPRAIV
jgi:predicted nucleotide-binding protein